VEYLLGPYRIDSESRVVWDQSVILRLPPKAVEFLLCLVERNGGVVQKEELHARVWPDSNVEESSLAQTASLIRKALKPGFGVAMVIETVPRRGYRLAIPAIAVEAKLANERSSAMVVDGPALALLAAPPPAIPTGEAVPPGGRGVLTRRHWLIGGSLVALLSAVALITVWKPSAPAAVHPLTGATGEEDDADVSADGERVVYTWRPEGSSFYNLYVKPTSGAAPTRVTNVDADDRCPVWSPDRSMIAFSRMRPNSREIRVASQIGGDGVEDRLVLATAPADPALTWSPDGKWLAYSGANPAVGGRGGISMISLETSERRQLTSPTAAYDDSRPRFSPDGRSVAFDRYTPVTLEHDIHVVPTGGGAPIRVTTVRSAGLHGLAWSEDGRDIVFASELRGNIQLFRASLAGGDAPRWIEAAGYEVSSPSVALHGHRMAFTLAYQNVDIWRISGPIRPTAPSPPEKLIASDRASYSPQYSPDGRRIAFISNRSGSCEVWVANADGSKPARLTSIGGTSAGSPAWSPDGRRIAFDRRQLGEGTFDIFVVPAEGGKPIQFTTDLTVHHSPSWSHDGKWIYFSSARSGTREIWRQPWPAGAAQQITYAGGYWPQESPDGKYVYYSKASDYGVWRTPLAGWREESVPEFSDAVARGYWAVTARGYYWAARGPAPLLRFFDLASRKTTILARGDALFITGYRGISVSPNEEWVLCPRMERPVHRVMLLENFR